MAVHFHTSEIKTNSWTSQAKKMRGTMPPNSEVWELNKVLEKAGPIYDSGRMIVEEGHLALEDENKFSTRRHLTPYGLEEVELRHVG